jgi:hypothetical protein
MIAATGNPPARMIRALFFPYLSRKDIKFSTEEPSLSESTERKIQALHIG